MSDETIPPTRVRTAALAGVLAAVAAVAATELLAGLLPGDRSILLAVGEGVIELTPGGIVRFAISTFGKANRAVLLLSMAAVAIAAGGTIGVGAARRPWVSPLGLGMFALLGAAAAIVDPLVPTLTAVGAPVGGAAVGVLALWWLLASAPPERGDSAVPVPGPGIGSRRAFLIAGASVTASALVAGMSGRMLQVRSAAESARRALRLPRPSNPLPPPSPAASLDVEGLSPLITPTEDFYRIDTALTVPRLDPESHVVRISGMVEAPFEIGYGQLLELADTEADVTLACVSNEVGGDLVGNARWQGVPLARLLDRAGVWPDATQIVGRAVDGWTAGFPVEAAFDGRPALVAVGMNGAPLPAEHGFPVRLVVAGLYGYVSDTKWLSEIELSTFEAFDAYWVPRGWSQQGPIKTQSRIDVPRQGARLSPGTVAIAGVAWAGQRGVSAVEISVDDGAWRATELSSELARSSWRQWRMAWEAPPGTHTIRVRATDGRGRTQTAQPSPPAPDGATGHHTIEVSVA